MFNQKINSTYDLKDATIEIVIILLVSFLLGYLFRYFFTKKSVVIEPTDEAVGLRIQLGKMQMDLNNALREKADIKKSITIEYSYQIDELKAKLTNARADLEQCLAAKASAGNMIKETPENVVDSDRHDDLKIIEGIGPALAKVLNNAGINTFMQLANRDEKTLREILRNEGSRFKVHDPSTWPEQARLASNESWEELKTLQEKINFGLNS